MSETNNETNTTNQKGPDAPQATDEKMDECSEERDRHEEATDIQLESPSLDDVASVSSSILNSPSCATTEDPAAVPEKMTAETGITLKANKGNRLSSAQKRRRNWYVRNGHSAEEALELARLPVEPDYLAKRQRSTESQSPNTSQVQEPVTKRTRSRNSDGPPAPGPQSGLISYKEMATAIHIAVTPSGYPAKIFTTEQLKKIRSAILDKMIHLDTPNVRPKFRNLSFKFGYLLLACADQATADWTLESVPGLVPWEGAQLTAMDQAKLPKLAMFLGYFQDSLEITSEDILRLVQNQNDGFCTTGWRIVRRKELSKTIELLVEMDGESAERVVAQSFQLNYMFGKARLRKVTGSAANTGRGNSAAKVGMAQKRSLTSASRPPNQSNKPVAGKVLPKAASKLEHQPLAQSRKVKTRKVPREGDKDQKHQPPAPKPHTQNVTQSVGRRSLTSRLQPMEGVQEEDRFSEHSEAAAGERHPQTGSDLDPVEGGSSTQK